jgi:GH25 family lysozyme M1 (1,4-beta-N-acetylmuramidase)
MNLIKGVDVSKHNPSIDWAKVKDQGYEFVYIKHSQGVGYLDPAFATNFNNAKALGLKIGLYHFASLNNPDEVMDAKAEAKFFMEATADIDADLLPVIDIETNEVHLTASEVEQWVRTYYEGLGQKCMLYSGSWFLNANLHSTHKLGNIPLWLSSYPLDTRTPIVTDSLRTTLKSPKPPIGWNDWVIWQWTGKGTLDGVNGHIDLNLAKTLPLK